MIFSITLCSCVEVSASQISEIIGSPANYGIDVVLPRGGEVSTTSGTVSGFDSWTATPTISTAGATYKITGYNTDTVSVSSTVSRRTVYQITVASRYVLNLPGLDPAHSYRLVFNNVSATLGMSPPSGGYMTSSDAGARVYVGGSQYFWTSSPCEIIVTSFPGGTVSLENFVDYVITTPLGTTELDTYHLGYDNLVFRCNIYDLGILDQSVVDAVNNTNQSVQQTTDAINKGNELQEEANETSKGILGQITDFFGSFFENIINAVKSLFIPEDGYFADFFQRLNDFFSEKLGMLYAPVDLFVEIMTAILNASPSSAGIPFPGIKWNDTWLIEPQTVNIPVDEFPELQEKLYFVTDVIMIGAVLMLVQNKYREVMGT